MSLLYQKKFCRVEKKCDFCNPFFGKINSFDIIKRKQTKKIIRYVKDL